MAISIGTAGWTIPSTVRECFSAEGSSLERYAERFPVTEINTSFHRSHRADTWARWRVSVPAGFRFSAKLPKIITHQRKLAECGEPLAAFLEEVGLLGGKLAVLLVQLPPKLEFDEPLANRFFSQLRGSTSVRIACEPRHPSWFVPAADELLVAQEVARVAADPALSPAAAVPGGWREFSYWRLHGSPAMYRSSYADRIELYADRLLADSSPQRDVWCIFDNTAASAATADAIALTNCIAEKLDRPGKRA